MLMGVPVVLSTTGREQRLVAISGRGGFGDVGRQGDACGAENRPDFARDRRADRDALVVLVDDAVLEPVEVAHQPVPLRCPSRRPMVSTVSPCARAMRA